jgi:hypothetical protein
MKPPLAAGGSISQWTKKLKPRDWVELVIGVLLLLIAFLGVTRRLDMPWWAVVVFSVGYVVLVGGVMVRVRSR